MWKKIRNNYATNHGIIATDFLNVLEDSNHGLSYKRTCKLIRRSVPLFTNDNLTKCKYSIVFKRKKKFKYTQLQRTMSEYCSEESEL